MKNQKRIMTLTSQSWSAGTYTWSCCGCWNGCRGTIPRGCLCPQLMHLLCHCRHCQELAWHHHSFVNLWPPKSSAPVLPRVSMWTTCVNHHRDNLWRFPLGPYLAFWAEKKGPEVAFVITEYRFSLAVEAMLEWWGDSCFLFGRRNCLVLKRFPEIIISFPLSFSSLLEAKTVTFWLCGSVKWQLILHVKVASLFNAALNIRSKYRSKYSILRKESQFCFLTQLRGGEWDIIISWKWDCVLYLSYAFLKC